MKPNFNNAVYYRDENSEAQWDNLNDALENCSSKENLIGVHSKLLLSDFHGVHIPRLFADNFEWSIWGLSDALNKHDLSILKDGPRHEWYWESWEVIMQKAEFKDEHGNVWRLHQDGDLFAITEFSFEESES